MIVPSQHTAAADVAAHYDDLDRFYRDIWGDHVHHGLWLTGRETPLAAVEQLVDYAAAPLGIVAGESVCDVGCGYGGTSRRIAERLGARVTGLTISPAQHAYAVDRLGAADNPAFLLRNWEENALPAESFDAVISIECLAHIENKPRFFAEIRRVLKPGRRAAVIAWLARRRARRWERRFLLEPICEEGRLPSMGDAGDYALMAEEAGLSIVGFEDLSRNVRRTWWICALRLASRLLSQSEYRRYLLRGGGNRIFALTLLRICFAYETGAMRLGLFVLKAPEHRSINNWRESESFNALPQARELPANTDPSPAATG